MNVNHKMNKTISPCSQLRPVTTLAWIMILWFSFCAPLPSNAEDADSNPGPKYPDIWYREYDVRPERVFDVYFSDFDMWGDEPVVILYDLEKEQGHALGFFSGKSQEICSVDFSKGKEKSVKADRHFYYSASKREIARRYFPPQMPGDFFINTADGGRLYSDDFTTLGRGEIIAELFPEDIAKKLHEDTKEEIPHSVEDGRKISEKRRTRLRRGEITYATIGSGFNSCEPIGSYLVKSDRSHRIVWAKALVRLYADRDKAPVRDDICGGIFNEKTRISSEVYPRLLLRDGTVLAIGPDAVVRIRQGDGSAPSSAFPKTFRIFDAVDVVKAKLELMRREAAVQKKCAEEGKDLEGHTPGCGLYRVETSKGFAMVLDEERLQLDLGKCLFNNEEFK